MNNSLNINIPKMITSPPYLGRAINCNSNACRLKIKSEITKQNTLARFETSPGVRKLLRETVGSLKLYTQASSKRDPRVQLSKPQRDRLYIHQSNHCLSRLESPTSPSGNRLLPLLWNNLTTLYQSHKNWISENISHILNTLHINALKWLNSNVLPNVTQWL